MKENVDSKWFGSHTGYVHHHGKQRWAAVFVAPQLNKEPTHLGFYRNRRNAIRAVRLKARHVNGYNPSNVQLTFMGREVKSEVICRMFGETDDELRKRIRQRMATANYGSSTTVEGSFTGKLAQLILKDWGGK